jgi:hypothetical protein
MADALHPTATQHLPSFITAPGETDVLMVCMSIFLLGAVLAFGILFLRLHTMPERMAHRAHKVQFEIVAVLGLIALFTHLHIFWIAGLLLAMVDLPDFGNSLARIAGSAEKIAGIKSDETAGETSSESTLDNKQQAHVSIMPPDGAQNLDSTSGAPGREQDIARATRKELSHV